MKAGSIYSSCSKKCKVCGKKTGDYRVFEQSEMRLEVPMCEEHWEEQKLVLASIEVRTESFLIEINKFFKR